jgi:hypothetical protein
MVRKTFKPERIAALNSEWQSYAGRARRALDGT